MRPIRITALAGALLLSATGLCAAQSYAGATQPPPRSQYPDGTGNVAVEDLNSGQLDQNYRGPWHEVPANRVRPGYVPPAYAPRPYPQGAYPQGTYPQGVYARPAYPPPPPAGY